MENLVIVRGGGDLATGTVYKLRKCGFPVLILESASPTAIRRDVAFSEAVYTGQHTVEGMTCYFAPDLSRAQELLQQGHLAVLVDPEGSAISRLKPMAVVDAILAKKNLGMSRDLAPITVALGPGFSAGVDVDAVVETQRGHDLGRVIRSGCAAANTGIPGMIGGYGKERVVRSPAAGTIRSLCSIGDRVKKGQTLALVETTEGEVAVTATLDGMLRGMIREGFAVDRGMKIADIDPREEARDYCHSISDKARCIAGGVVEAILLGKGERGL